MAADYDHLRGPARYPAWTQWPVYWPAIWVGALTAFAVSLIIGLIAIAVGAHQIGPGHQFVSWRAFGIGAMVFAVIGAFAANVAGAWVAGRISGIHWAEHAMMHGAIVWLVTIPGLVLLAAFGAGNFFGGWMGGLSGTPSWVVTAAAGAAADPAAATIARNEALGAVFGLLIGLVGAVLGGWMASGEPMSLMHKRDAEHDHEHHGTYTEREYVAAGPSTTVRVKPVETP